MNLLWDPAPTPQQYFELVAWLHTILRAFQAFGKDKTLGVYGITTGAFNRSIIIQCRGVVFSFFCRKIAFSWPIIATQFVVGEEGEKELSVKRVN